MKDLLSPKQVAQAMGVSEASLKRWCDRGVLQTLRTVGGHRRLPMAAVLQFLRESGHRLVRPEVLGLPAAGAAAIDSQRTAVNFGQALERGDEDQVRRLGFNAYLAGATVAELCDELIAPTMAEIGERWMRGEMEVYQERRAVEICHRLLYELVRRLPGVFPDAPLAMTATLEGDPYALPVTMVEGTLRENGWRAESFGAGNPAASLGAAIRQRRPRMFCLSVSHIESPLDFLNVYRELHAVATEAGVAMVIGGRGLTEAIRHDMNYTAHCDALRNLVAFARALYVPPEMPAAELAVSE